MAEEWIEVIGMQEIQRDMLDMIVGLEPPHGAILYTAVKRLILRLHKYAVKVTHVDTGALRASHVIDMEGQVGYVLARLFISRDTVNPKHGERPYKYGIEEHERGGSHAFYARTFFDEGEPAAVDALDYITKRIAKGQVYGVYS